MSDEAPSTGTMAKDGDVSMEPVTISADSTTIPPELSCQDEARKVCGGTWAGRLHRHQQKKVKLDEDV